MNSKKQPAQKNEATGETGKTTPSQVQEPEPDTASHQPKPPSEKETDKHIIAPDGASTGTSTGTPGVKQEPEPLF